MPHSRHVQSEQSAFYQSFPDICGPDFNDGKIGKGRELK